MGLRPLAVLSAHGMLLACTSQLEEAFLKQENADGGSRQLETIENPSRGNAPLAVQDADGPTAGEDAEDATPADRPDPEPSEPSQREGADPSLSIDAGGALTETGEPDAGCVPDCDGKQCGDDGCNDVCGFCAEQEVCSETGQCECLPDCDAKACGGDGCGGSCGTCAADEFCSDVFACLARDDSRFNYEHSAHDFETIGAFVVGVAQSTERAYLGTGSLKVSVDGSGAEDQVLVASPGVGPDDVITFHVWVPAGSNIRVVFPYIMDQNWRWIGTWTSVDSLSAGSWNTIRVTVPSDVVMPISELGVQFETTSDDWTGSVFIDSIDW